MVTHAPTGPARADSIAPRLALILAVGTVLLFSPVRHFDFLNFDDPACVSGEPHVRGGLSVSAVKWAFSSVVVAHWKPLTSISHMVDCDLFGLDAGAHHLMNVLWHGGAVVFLFLALNLMTGAAWRSAFVAALFAWHPLRVESVAWITERKDVLSGFFWMFTLWLYARHARQPSRWSWPLVLVAFTLGLLSKSIVVVLPFVLLLLDVWPLKRVAMPPNWRDLRGWAAALRQPVREKALMFALALAAAAGAFAAAKSVGGVMPASMIMPAFRMENALVAGARYLGKTLWPENLAILYPFPESWPLALVAASAALMVAITWLVLRHLASAPWLAVGWFWFCGTLVPVIGLVQAGPQSIAERYTYLPHVGLFMAFIWGLGEVVARKAVPARFAALAAAVVVAGCVAGTRFQLQFWRDSESVFRRAIAVTGGSDIAHMNLGNALGQQGRTTEAVGEYAAALRFRERAWTLKRIPPHLLAESHRFLGSALVAAGQLDPALSHFQSALRLSPDDPDALAGLGTALALQGRTADAAACFERALRAQPGHARSRLNFARLLADQGRHTEALALLDEGIRLSPWNAELRQQAGDLLVDLGKPDEAAAAYGEALRVEPGNARALYNLGNLRASQGRHDEAMRCFTAAAQGDPRFAEARLNLGAMLLQLGKPADAVPHFEAGLRLKPGSIEGHHNIAQALAQLGRSDEARAHLETARRLNAARQPPQ